MREKKKACTKKYTFIADWEASYVDKPKKNIIYFEWMLIILFFSGGLTMRDPLIINNQ